MAILKLPKEVRSFIRSGIAIASTTQCVTELVLNSLDSGADSVVIHLDVSNYKLQVVDNGNGITFDDLNRIGIRYNTSKCQSLSDLQNNLKFYGYRGEALASLRESCGTVIILTRPKSGGQVDTYCKTFSRGKIHPPTKALTNRPFAGTTITVQDFLCNAPVRQKRIKPKIDVEEVRHEVEAIALAHPHVTFSIKDESNNSIVFEVSKSKNDLETFNKIYGTKITSHLYPIGPLTSGKLSIKGFISTYSHYNKRLQFLFVNGRLVKGTKIHKLINMIMRKTDVLRGKGPWQELPMPERVRDFLWVSPSKKQYRYCVFLVKIICPLSEYDITLDPNKTLIEFCDWDSLLECIENVVKDFLKKNNLAFIDQDVDNERSNDGSPSSVLDEVETLDKEDALGQKLSRFKCINQPESKTVNVSRAICSLPAKRYYVPKTVSNNSKVTTKSKCTLDNTNESKSEICINKGNNMKYSTNVTTNAASEIAIDKKNELINKLPLLHKNAKSIPDPLEDEPKIKTFLFGLHSSDNSSSHGPLSEFRKLFKQNEILPKETPDDLQLIRLEKPPPIVRRNIPLGHRIKALMNLKQFKSTGVNTITTCSILNECVDQNKKRIIPYLFKDCPFDKTRQKVITINGDVPINSLTVNPSTSSGYFKKNESRVSVATQTESNEVSIVTKPNLEINNIMPKKVLKPNLKKLKDKRKQYYQEVLGCKSKTALHKTELKINANNAINLKEVRDNDNLDVNNKLNICEPCNEDVVEVGESAILKSEDFLLDVISKNDFEGSYKKLMKTYNSNSNVHKTLSHTTVSDNYQVPDCNVELKTCSLSHDKESSTLKLGKLTSIFKPNDLAGNSVIEMHYESESLHSKDLIVREVKRDNSVMQNSKESSHTKIYGNNSDLKQKVQPSENANFEQNITDFEMANCLLDSVNPISNNSAKDVDFHESCHMATVPSDVEILSASNNGDILEHNKLLFPVKCPESNFSVKTCDLDQVDPSTIHNVSVGECAEIEINSEVNSSENSDCVKESFINTNNFNSSQKRPSPVINDFSGIAYKKPFIQDQSVISEEEQGSLLKGCNRLLHDEYVSQIHRNDNEKPLTISEIENEINSFESTHFSNSSNKKCLSFGEPDEWDIALVENCVELENKNTSVNDEHKSETEIRKNINKKRDIKEDDYQNTERFEMFSRQSFLPKGFSPIMLNYPKKNKRTEIEKANDDLSSNCGSDLYLIQKNKLSMDDELSWIKWGQKNENRINKEFLTRTEQESDKGKESVLSSFMSEIENKKYCTESEVLSASTNNQVKSITKIFNVIYPCTFSKKVLSSIKMLGKLDSKFIVALISMDKDTTSNAIVLFDQHAVHERIRLEKLTRDYQVVVTDEDCSGKKIKFKSVPPSPLLEIILSSTEARMLESFQEHFEQLGLFYERSYSNEHDEVTVNITGIPSCLSSKDIKELGPLGLKEQVHSLIREQVENLMLTRGIGTSTPEVLRDAINMEACRGAVKFGDALSNRECRWLLRKLSTCDTPFQCAHGRPSMYPIADIRHLGKYCYETEQENKPQLWKLRKMWK